MGIRARNIKPGFFRNEILANFTFKTRLVFIGLWCLADREGRLEKRPLRIKAEIFPYDSIDMQEELKLLEQDNFIKTYSVKNQEYIQIVNFKKHQNPHHTEAKSKLPPMHDEKLTVSSPLDNGEYPPGITESLNHRITESLNQMQQATATTIFDCAMEKKQEIQQLFPNHDFDFVVSKMVAYYENKRQPKDLYKTILNWFKNEFVKSEASGAVIKYQTKADIIRLQKQEVMKRNAEACREFVERKIKNDRGE